MDENIPHLLEIILKRSGLDQDKFAETIGLKKAAFNNYLKGRRELPKKVISTLKEVYNVNPAAFFDAEAELYIEEKTLPGNLTALSPSDFKRIPILGTIACGDPILAEQNIEGYAYESLDSLPKGNIFALRAKGDSMEPTIPSGSIVLIREQSDVESGEIAAVLVNGDTEATLKRVKRLGQITMLMPDNTKYDPIPVTKEKTARIIGKAVGFRVNF